MKKATPIIPLFKKFIRDTETGRRLKKNGERIKMETVQNYTYVLQNLVAFTTKVDMELRICDARKLNTAEFTSEKNYWKKFYRNFTTFLYQKGCHDNYVGTNIKIIRTFFNYLKNDRDLFTGDFQKLFYLRVEEVEILVLSPEQLKFLIHDVAFQETLSKPLCRIKDMFVFGCATGLRFSDMLLLTKKNFEQKGDDWYLKMKSKKTKTFSLLKIPKYAVAIFQKYKSKSSKKPLFEPISLINFNKNLKKIGKIAGFDSAIKVSREKRGATKNTQKELLFYEKMSSYMMRRTAITTMLILGMPEHLVRKVSGHSNTSNSFGRYVHYAQSYMDMEIQKVHEKLDTY